MEQLKSVTGIAAPLVMANIDTDQIVPAKELVRVRTEGYAPSLFAYWRYREGTDRDPDPRFILNQEPWSGASILLAGSNFGCGSSREAAPTALRQWGFRAVVAPSFGGIFFNNCFRNGLLPVELSEPQIDDIVQFVTADPLNRAVTVDLVAQEVRFGDRRFGFRAPPVLRQMLLEGRDEIDMTLARREQIEAFRLTDGRRRPWAYDVRPG